MSRNVAHGLGVAYASGVLTRRDFIASTVARAAFLWAPKTRRTLSRSKGPTFSVRDFGAQGDGRTDDADAIQRAIESAMANAPATVLFPAVPQWYQLRKPLRVRDGRGIVLLGDGSSRPIVMQGQPNTVILRLDNCADCEVSGLHLRGLGRQDPLLYQPTTYAPGLLLVRCSRLTVRNCTVESAVSNGIEALNSSDCIVSGNECYDTALFNGIGWAGGTGNRFIGNSLHHNRGQGIECRSMSYFRVERNHCYGNGDPSFNQSAGITVEAENGRVDVVESSNTSPIRIRTVRPHLMRSGSMVTVRGVAGNTAANGTFSVVVLDQFQMLLVGSRGNGKQTSVGNIVVPVDQGVATESTDGAVIDNLCEDNNGYGIYVAASNNAKVSGIVLRTNTIRRNILDGIACVTGAQTQKFRDCSRVSIQECRVEFNRRGVLCYHCADITLTNNIIQHNSAAGIDTQGSTMELCAHNCVSDNRPNATGLPHGLEFANAC